MNSIPIEIVMYVTGLSEEQLTLLHEVDTDTIRSLEDGSGWHCSIPVLDWCNLACGLRSVRDDDNQIINWLWIKVKERAAD
ncbi:MAG: hypothetical protein OXG68_02340 [Chloroflexi bacterium]|nr:hypothetical protein [Chloroflexota bacterium]